MRVFVYYNLHRNCLSLRALQGPYRGRVLAHASAVDLRSVQFKVSEAGRQRVLREKAKNVHAGLVGELTAATVLETRLPGLETLPSACAHKSGIRVTYDPYKYASFVDAESKSPVWAAEEVCVRDKAVYAQVPAM